VDLERFAFSVPGPEKAYTRTDAAVDARALIGRLNELALIAGPVVSLEIAAAVIAAEADAIDLIFIIVVPERPGYEMLFPGFIDEGIGFFLCYGFEVRADCRMGCQLEAYVHPGTLTVTATFPAAAVRDPELFVPAHDGPGLVRRTNEMLVIA